jgi:hypothetical protein
VHIVQKRACGRFNLSATAGAKYVSTPSAPARLKAVRVSSMARSRSSQAFCAGAKYSPYTWSAKAGMPKASLLGENVEIGQAGLDHNHVGALGDVELDLALIAPSQSSEHRTFHPGGLTKT